MANEKPVCATCGSSDVLKDAYAVWDNASQQWELNSTYDDTTCNNCERSCKLNWIDSGTP